MRQLIALTGYARSGKDTAAEALVADGWTRVAFADPLRKISLVLNPWIKTEQGGFCRLADLVQELGWTEAKRNAEVRSFLIDLGTPGVRANVCDDAWIRAAERTIENIPGNVVITDCRFPNETRWVRDRGGLVVRIYREGTEPQGCADWAVDEIKPDYVVNNGGSVEQLQAAVRKVAACHLHKLETVQVKQLRSLAGDGYLYLATVYSRHPGGIEQAFFDSARAAAWCVRNGINVYCPIAHTHPVAVHGGIDPLDHGIWLPFDLPLMASARGLVVVTMPGWDQSVGIAHERQVFIEAGKPVEFLDWARISGDPGGAN